MHAFELALFVVIVALALALIGTIVRPYFRPRRARPVDPAAGLGWAGQGDPEPRSAPHTLCPACHREFGPGLQYCPHDARELVPAHDPRARALAPGMACSTCGRSFDGTKRYCPFDGDELVPTPLARGTAGHSSQLASAELAGAVLASAAFAGAVGKICPHCSRRYESEATFCGRDGSELVTVN
jgi:predicted amidophosphoribosyltransferase